MTDDYEYVMRLFNWTGDENGDQVINSLDSPVTALPSFAKTPDGGGFYEFTYAYLSSSTDASDRGFSSYVVDHLDTNGVNSYIQTVIGDVFQASSSTSYNVNFTDVAKILVSDSGDNFTADITFGQIDNGSEFFEGDGTNPGFTYNYTTTSSSSEQNNTNPDIYGKVFFNTNANIGWSGSDTAPGTVGYWAVMHEMGHAMGLKHEDLADGAMGAGPSDFDNQNYTMMAYLPYGWHVNSTGTGYDNDGNGLYYDSTHPLWAYGLQLLDVAAIQGIYGINYDTRSGDTLYDLASIGRDDDASKAFLYTIWDGGGTNVLDTTGFSGAAKVDLRQGEFSSIGSNGNGQDGFDPLGTGRDVNNLSIAYHALIQNAITPQDNSILVGNAWNNVLFAGGNNSKIYSDGIVYNNDAGFITGISGDSNDPNNSIPSIQNDVLIGGLGNTTFYSSLGSNVIAGYYDETFIDSATSGWATSWDAAGQFTGSNNATGAALPDIVTEISGRNDAKIADYSQLDASENVTLAGGTLHIEVSASGSTIIVNKDTDLACVGTDQLSHINGIVGTDGNDTLSVESAPGVMTFYASKGDDTYDYASGSYDVDYSNLNSLSGIGITGTISSSGMVLDKSDTAGSIGEDTFTTGASSFYITGTSGDDSFSGTLDTSANATFYGSKGDDTYDVAAVDGFVRLDYSSLAAVSTNPYITVTASSSGLTIDKTDDTGSIGEDTTSTDIHSVRGTGSASDSFTGFLISGVEYDDSGTSGHTYNFDLTEFGTSSTHSAAVVISDIAGGNINVANGTVVSSDYFADSFSITLDLDYSYWNSAVSAFDFLSIEATLLTSGSGVQTVVAGATTYEFGSGYSDLITASSGDHVIDGGPGVNTIDYSAATGGVTLSLASGSASDNGWGYTDVLANIQNVIGSSHNDTITGDSNDNVITGAGGNNVLDGGGGINTLDYSHDPSGVTVDLSSGTATNGYGGTDTISNFQNVIGSAYGDTITGDSNDNVLSGGAGNDILIGGGGNDVLVGGPGNDSMDGGTGTNTVDYSHDPAGVTVDLSAGTATDGWGGSDTLTNIQNVIGSAYDDVITGNSSGNVLIGGDGNDTLTGGSGDDILDGGSGNNALDGGTGTNTVDYSHDPGSVYVDLLGGYALNGYGGTDTLTNIQNVVGSAFGDIIIGDNNDNHITGGAGNDWLVGNAGNDVIDGGGGVNTVDYSGDPAGVTVDLSAGTATDGWSGSDTLSNIQNIVGSYYDDILTGDSHDNVFVGNGGNNVIDGGGGINTIDYSNDPAGVTVDMSTGTATNGYGGTDTLTNIQIVIVSHFDNSITGDGTTTVSYANSNSAVTIDLSAGTATGDGSDTLINIHSVIGSAYDDTITGSSSDDVISGGGGNNIIDGGGGVNTVDYSHDPSGVSVDLSMGTATNGNGGTDTLSNIQTVIGSHYDDSITGDGTSTVSYATALNGVTVDLSAGTATGDGSDTLSGIANVTGSSHDDTITGDSNDNVLYGNGGNDYITGGAGADTFLFKGATAFTGVTTIADFNTGQGDKIDINDVLQGHYNPLTDAIANFVSLTTSGSDTLLKVDLDGAGTVYSPTTIATIHGVTGLDVATLISDGNLIVPT